MTKLSLMQFSAYNKTLLLRSYKIVSYDEVNDYLMNQYTLWGQPFVDTETVKQAVVKVKDLTMFLTNAQLECFFLSQKGLTVSEIARKLGKTHSTIRRHLIRARERIAEKQKTIHQSVG